MNSCPRTACWLLACASLVSFGAACGELDMAQDHLSHQTEVLSGTCSNGNGLSVFYYGDATTSSEMPTLRAARPNFVVAANNDPAAPDYYHFDDPATRAGPTGIRALAYIPMNYGRQNECQGQTNTNSDCSNVSCNGCNDCVPIQDRITTAMNAGYDGVFFDETDSSLSAYNVACFNAVKQRRPSRLVIVNPGVGNPDPAIFEAADIVSVENDYIDALGAYNQPSWRWLAIQGDPGTDNPQPYQIPPQTLSDAEARLSTFRSNGGFWYYSAEPHWQLESWFPDFAAWVKQQGSPACPTSFNVTVDALALDNGNAEVAGMCVFVDGDTSTCAGFTPFTTALTAGMHTLTLTDYPPNAFQHWDDGTSAKARTVNVTADTTYDGYYTTH